MENSDQRLVELMKDISLIYVEAKDKQTLQKKLESYTNGTTLINEAEQLLESLQNQIANLDMAKADKSQISNANKLIELLSTPNLNFKEVMGMIQQLRQISAGLPNTSHITDNMEKDVVIYEERDVDANVE